MTGVRGVLRVLAGAGLLVTAGVATNQVLSDGRFSWTWLYASLAVAVLSLVYTELGTATPAAPSEDTAHGRRRVYLHQLRASVRDMETVGVATQSEFVFRMRQVYVDVSVVPQTLHAAAREPYLGSVSGGERRSLESVLRDAERDERSRVLAVIGGPGSGKTTLARNTALELCEHRWRPWRRRLPVLLYLRDHATALLSHEPPTLAAVAGSAGWLEGRVSVRWLHRRLDRGGCVVLLDGLDEVADPADRSRVVAWVGRQIQRHPRNTYVVTSRPHGYESNPLPGAEVLQVRRFTWQQIERFLRQWSFATESRAREGTRQEIRTAADRSADDLLSRLRKQAALYDLASNPLLLTMTANVHRYRGQLPGSRAELYAEMCDVLLHRRSEARGLRDATGLTGPHKQHVAQHLALAMMKARVRDWSAREAARAIRRPLRHIPGQVTPEVFLEEARKSGLIVEREHGVHGFAHLTLQEYLAAAQLSTPRADTAVLTASVDDPWWRETTLLWSAANDATPVITACLERDTVPALALAFECADQARTVDPEVRDRLENLVVAGGPDPAGLERPRLLVGIVATHALRETIQLDDTTALCARPVPRTVYRHFVREEREAGRFHPGPDHLPEADANDMSAMVGMQAGDAERFVDWLNDVTGDGGYRLPTRDELRDPAAAMAADLTRHTVWARDGTGTVLHAPPNVAWPYTHALSLLPTLPVTDRQHLTLYLELLGMEPAQRARVESWARVLSRAVQHAPELRRYSSLEFPFALATALAFDLALTRTVDLVRRFDPAFDPSTVNQHTFDTSSLPSLGGSRDLERVRRLAAALTPALDLSVELGLAGIGALEPDDFAPHSAYQPLTDVLGIARARALTHVRRIDPARTPDLTADSLPDRDHVLARARTLDLAPRLLQGLDPVLSPDDSPAVYLGHDFRPTPEPLLALDLVLDPHRHHHAETLRPALTALRTLIRMSPPRLATGPSVLANLDSHLAETADWDSFALRAPEDPATCVQRARDLLQEAGVAELVDDQTRTAVDTAVELLTALRDRRAPSDARVLACARTAVLAAVSSLSRVRRGVHEPRTLLYLAWHSLTALDHPIPGDDLPNQILLLTRTRP